MKRSVVWVKPRGAELATVRFGEGRLEAEGVALGGGPFPYRLEYELTTGDRYVTARLLVRASGDDPASGPWVRHLELVNRPEGVWTVSARAEGHVDLPPPGGDAAALAGALDCDLGLSPLTNTMPVLRGGYLDGGERADHLMAWVSVPDLRVLPDEQTYAPGRREGGTSIVEYRSPRWDRDIVVDADGLVVEYPGIGRRA
ncbi:putative glycolipid-binding domain-containing protein [Actinomadura flavalba]|uniref:putative glycolipid-binding domain-containing protein n=1 Tax=Actinomadura flavalba TaxID=1120938 RepID=UPI0003762E3E|nr:putative glycolipid-binding domain-containing protein [Actinomadura flavalba]